MKKITKTIIILLCICLFLFPISNIIFAFTLDGVRIADDSTVDNYKTIINDSNTNLNAGMLWTDKSVFSYDETSGKVSLDQGYSFLNSGRGIEVNFNDDFLNVFSTLATSQVVNEKIPIDLVFIVDTSSSMGNEKKENSDHSDSRIQKTIDAINKATEILMESNDENRIGLTVFGNASIEIAPLDHYHKNDETIDYITVNGYKGSDNKNFYLNFNMLNSNDEPLPITRITNKSKSDAGKVPTTLSGTNIQSGIWTGMSILANEEKTTYRFPDYGATVSRIPVVFLLTDGGSNAISGGPWWDVQYTSTMANSPGGSNEDNNRYNGSIVILQNLLTASYLTSKIEHNYYLYGTKPLVYTFCIDLASFLNAGNWTTNRLKAILDPSLYFNEEGKCDSSQKNCSNKAYAKGYNMGSKIIPKAYELWENWSSNSNLNLSLKYKSGDSTKTFKFDNFPSDGSLYPVEIDDMKRNVYYVTENFDVNTDNIVDLFTELIDIKTGKAFSPIKKDDGILKYEDPIGYYMDVKDVNKLILFGKEYNIIKDEIKTNNNPGKIYYKVVNSSKTDDTIINNSYTDKASFNLSDILIWVDKTDEYKEKLYIEIPSVAIPLKVDTIFVDEYGEVVKFQSNKNSSDALPLRIFYTTSLNEKILNSENKIDTSLIDPDYEDGHTVNNQAMQYINFYSNYYNIKKNLEIDRGDAYTEFIPSKDNRYYLYQNNFTLYENSNNGEGELVETGGNVTLSNEVLDLSTIDKDKTYYLQIFYYEQTNSEAETGKLVKYALAKKGSEFFDESGECSLTYYDKEAGKETDSRSDNTVVTTKKGGLQSFIHINSEEYKNENKTETSSTIRQVEYMNNINNNKVINYLGNNGKLNMFYKYLYHHIPITGGLGIKRIIIIGLSLILITLLLVVFLINKKNLKVKNK